MKSQHAQVASIIRSELKKHGIKAKVTSSTGSMTSSVNVTVYDQMPAIKNSIESFCSKFEMGSFNGMTDMYEYTNNREDIPQVKFIFVSNSFSDELRQKAWSFIRESYGYKNAPEHYLNASNTYLEKHLEMAHTIVYRELANESQFWSKNKPVVKVMAVAV